MTVTCTICGKRIEGLLAYDNHMRVHRRSDVRANPLVRAIVLLAIGREITRDD